ncbi:glyceraldehyde-3-phosphate dehydrogenase 2 [Alicyclobacillus contaminans]|uniref:type I glyceraldehyde-3-phosphate dehydrogenase n=1 Tax=Alicyclobacillus contaminans TaxID=392016 RepID=UPI00041D5EC3|nr:type I glyceraldehyde-3-phosphate dehydrogenase [Alicyclobacillus contaminans]GMA49193.1 glyceraldehyde-3-phosphate dehydrogenase 2 [Alicyclobacillus contaminans]
MTVRVAINGFGRIGRMVYRRALEFSDVELVAVNGTADVATLAHLLKYDTVHGTWSRDVALTDTGWRVGDRHTRVFSTRNPEELPWGDLEVDVVIESTGQFRTRDTAGVHLRQGAKRVIISAPAKTEADADVTLVMGVNHHVFRPDQHRIVSGASCTTNCLAPLVKALHEAFGVDSGLVTTVHAYTNDQRSLDNPHKDLRRARACGQSIIPTSTGAAKAIGLVLPELKGKLNGISLRVPTPNVSIVDLVADVRRDVTVDGVNDALRRAAQGSLNGILGFSDEPLVSSDFNGDARSAIVDGLTTMVQGDRRVKVLAWYDNEWGYACRMVDLARWVGGREAEWTAVEPVAASTLSV